MTRRASNGRYATAERIRTETTTTVTERLTVEQPPSPEPGPPPGRTSYVFRNLIRHPPPDARWAHPGFIADEAARAAAQLSVTAAFPPRGPAPTVVVVAEPPVPYPPLAEDTLAHEFTDADREHLTQVLGELPEMTP